MEFQKICRNFLLHVFDENFDGEYIRHKTWYAAVMDQQVVYKLTYISLNVVYSVFETNSSNLTIQMEQF